MITQPGTDVIHGSAYDFLRNTLLDADNWFNNLYEVSTPAGHRNNFDFTICGPTTKNKTFSFGTTSGISKAPKVQIRQVFALLPNEVTTSARFAQRTAEARAI